MFAYPDAARYRLGVNYQQLPCNTPVSQVYSPYQRDGAFRHNANYGGDPNFVGSSLRPVQFKKPAVVSKAAVAHEKWVGEVSSYSSEVTDEDFVQSKNLWELMGKTDQQQAFVHNLSNNLRGAIPRVQKEAIGKSMPPWKAESGADISTSDVFSSRQRPWQANRRNYMNGINSGTG
jgi:catalase